MKRVAETFDTPTKRVKLEEITPLLEGFHTPDAAELKPAEQLTMKAGLMADGSKYFAIDKLKEGAISHFIGVVAYASTSLVSSGGDWHLSVKVLDPSNTEVESMELEGCRINFFAPYKEWLPVVKAGEVLVVRDIKIEKHNGKITGTGHKDRARWAVYSPKTKEFSNGNRGNAPEGHGLAAGGKGFQFSPFYSPSAHTKNYCERLSAWWEGVMEVRKKSFGQAESPEARVPAYLGHVVREHRLISEIGPEKAPSGYFDCTVEILNSVQTDGPVFSLFVTDYTRNEELAPCRESWCPEALRQCVLRIECWDAAAGEASNMQIGGFYHIRNARAMVSRHGTTKGYTQGKLVEVKWSELDPAIEGGANLEALKRRKQLIEAQCPMGPIINRPVERVSMAPTFTSSAIVAPNAASL